MAEQAAEQNPQQTPQMGTYDASSQTPYQAPQTPPLPQIEAPPQRAPESTQQPKGPGPIGGGTKGVISSLAFMADSVLRGVMRGREQAQIKSFMQTKRNIDGAKYSYNNDAEKYRSLVLSGADPKEIEQAKAAVTVSYARLIDAYAPLDQQQKPSKKKKGGNEQPSNPLADAMQKDDPA